MEEAQGLKYLEATGLGPKLYQRVEGMAWALGVGRHTSETTCRLVVSSIGGMIPNYNSCWDDMKPPIR